MFHDKEWHEGCDAVSWRRSCVTLSKSEAHYYATTCNSKPNGKFSGRLPPLMMHAFA